MEAEKGMNQDASSEKQPEAGYENLENVELSAAQPKSEKEQMADIMLKELDSECPIDPINRQIVFIPVSNESKTPGGLLLAESEGQMPWGQIKAVADDCICKKLVPGVIMTYSPLNAFKIMMNGIQYFTVHELQVSDIIKTDHIVESSWALKYKLQRFDPSSVAGARGMTLDEQNAIAEQNGKKPVILKR